MMQNERGLNVAVWGHGVPVILVHGSGSADPEATWAAQAPLAGELRLVILARRGYLGSTIDRLGDLGAEIEDVAFLLGCGAHLVGLSYGGLIAILVAAQHHQYVRSLTLIEPAALALVRGDPRVRPLVDEWGALLRRALDHSPDEFFRDFMKAVYGSELPASFRLPHTFRQAVTAQMHEVPPWQVEIPIVRLSQAAVPTLIVTGGWSPPFELAADTLGSAIGAERVVIPGAGHEVQKSGEPFNQLLMRFVSRHDIVGSSTGYLRNGG